MKKKQLKEYHGHIDFKAVNSAHTQAFLFLQEHCLTYNIKKPRVLEIGCSSGYFSAALKDNGFYVYGVEPFTTAAKAAGLVDELFHGTVEEFCMVASLELRQSFDAIVLGDVLEHLEDPEGTLRALGSFLNDDGVVIASVPNITHIGIRRMLEDGQWMYQKYGLLDSTHIRFFSWHSLRTMFIQAGFGIDRRYNTMSFEFQIYPSAQAIYDLDAAEPSSAPLNEHDHIFQFVVRASKKALASDAYVDTFPQNILVVTTGVNDSLINSRLTDSLARYLSAVNGGELRVIEEGQYHNDHLFWADVLIVHRELSPSTLDFIRNARKIGLAIVYDVNDLYLQLPAWSKKSLTGIDKINIGSTIAAVNRVTCTSNQLKNQLQQMTSNIQVVPSVILSSKSLPDPSKKHYSNDCSLVIAASDPVVVNFLVQPVRLLCEALPSLKLVLVGPIASNFQGITKQIELHDQCSSQEFSEILNSIDNGIGLIPLDCSLFSSCKSPIKYFHYSSCGIVTIASAVLPYIEAIENGKNGLLVENSIESWYNGVMQLVNDFKMRQLLLVRAISTWQRNGSDKIAIESWKKTFKYLPKPIAKSTLFLNK